MYDMDFNNETALYSSIYTCRVNPSEFNYSSNPTFLSGSEIRVKGGNPTTDPRAFFTTVGLYNAQDQLLAVAKLSKPIESNPKSPITVTVRLDT